MDFFTKIVRRLSTFAWRKEIETCNGFAYIKSFNIQSKEGNEKLDITIQQKPEVAHWVGKCFASMIYDSPNYTELKFDVCGKYKDKFEWITVTVKKGNGKTPHQLKSEAERERDELKVELNRLLPTAR